MSRNDISWDELSGPTIDRRTAMRLLGLGGAGALAGCLGGGEEDEEEETPEEGDYGGRLQAGWYIGDIGELYPAFINVGQYFQISANVFSGLVALEEDLSIRGDLAEDWEVEDDGHRYVFELRDDVLFHNGEEFTAEDVRFTVEHNIEVEAPQAGRLSTLEPVDEGGVEIIDEYTVALNWEEPTASALAHLCRGPGRAVTIINETALEEMGRQDYSLEPVGTGAFEVVEHDVGSEIVLDRFDDYFETDEDGNELPYLDGVDIQLIPEPGTLVNALQGGDIYLANLLPPENVDEVQGAPDVEVSTVVGNTWIGLSMNQESEPLDDPDVRLGIAKALDVDAFAQNAYFGYAEPAEGVFSDAPEWIARDDTPDDQSYDPEEAEELLEGTGAADTTFQILQTGEDIRAARTARDQLLEVGLDVEVDQVTDATYWEQYEDSNYDMTVVGSVDKPDPEESVWNYYRLPDEGGAWNHANYENEEVHQLLSDQRNATDEDERAEILWEIEDILVEEAPHAYLAHQEDVVGYNESVQGFVHIPSYLRNFHTVWLDE